MRPGDGKWGANINDHNAVLIARNLLATTAEADPAQRHVEGRLLAPRLALLPPPRVYKLFGELRRAKVNNRRTRAIMRDWLAARPDLAFDAVKYRSAVKAAVRHAHLRLADEPGKPGLVGTLGRELGPYLFVPNRRAPYSTPILEAWRWAHYEQAALYELPYTVAEGFAAKHGIPRAAFLERIAPRLTRLERLRAQARRRQDEWTAFHDQVMAGGLLGDDYTYQHVYAMGRYRLSRFLPPFERQRESHIGELITDEAGRLAYLKTFRLSENQVRRGHLLTRLAANDWSLSGTATALGVTEPELGLRVEAAGFGSLLRQDVLDHYRAQARRDRP